MRIPNAVHEAHPWRIREIAPDFTVEDVWALPVRGEAGDFPEVLDTLTTSDPTHTSSLPTRVLWGARDLLGKMFDLGRVSSSADEAVGELPIPGTSQMSLGERLPVELRGTADDVRFGALPFVPLYRTDEEFAAEISNRTVHGVLHLAWAKQSDGTFQAQLAVYVKPRGTFGKAYLAFIKPFRYLIVYPALMRQVGRQWDSRRAR